MSKWGLLAAGGLLLVAYNLAQGDVTQMRSMPFSTVQDSDKDATPEQLKRKRELEREQYGPSMAWLDRVLAASSDKELPNPERIYRQARFARVIIADGGGIGVGL